ncbi:hypothetical protein PY257_13440 [Ramlibacter sp. H39-3-26]|uniref:hypothetical protein n=1 Tax=Curvibacter soli TaxID=3031331 RepID=UPI0023DAFFC5|nr:hypothetical protein [Ramlibacter sp. H39-3-26]MDF1486172.1 hypothetical protein [Ramlibacter sp. H39-3-26]
MEIQSILNNAVVQAEQEAVATTNKTRLIDVFRENYDDWNGRLFPAWKKVGKVCHQELALLLNQVGFSTVNPAMVSRYMKLVRDERKKNRSSVTVTQSAKTTVKNHSVSAPELVTVGATGSEDRDCLDPSWLGDEPNWTELVKPGARRPKIVEDWDSYWENVWRWLYSLADAHGLNSFDRTVYAGFKKISASIGDLWLDLSKVRRLMNSAGVPLDPKGIGKERA